MIQRFAQHCAIDWGKNGGEWRFFEGQKRHFSATGAMASKHKPLIHQLLCQPAFLAPEGEKNGGRHFRATSLSTRLRGRVFNSSVRFLRLVFQLCQPTFLAPEGEKNGGRHFRVRALSTCPSGRVCQRYGSDEPRPTWRCRLLTDFEQKITKVSIAPPFGPARGSQPGAQAGRHALEIRKWDVRNVKIGPVIRDRSDEASRGNASGGERHVAFRGAKDHTLPSPRIMPVIRAASAPNGRRQGGFDELSAF